MSRRGAALLAVALAAPAAGRDLWGEGDRSLALRTTLKASLLLSRAPDDPVLYPAQTGAESLWRLRLEAEARPGPVATALVAWETRLRTAAPPGSAAFGVGILPSEAYAPYRIRPLDWPLAQAPGLSWRSEIDRASVALHLPRAEVTVGRQAVGWGRGVLFGAVDLFAPFSPLEADREWRRGVDAIRADVRIADHVSIDSVAALGESVDASAFATRLRGYAGRVDAEVVAGWRAQDWVLGATSSAAVGDAEVHGELAWFGLPEPLPAGAGGSRSAWKAVAGTSYRFAVGRGLVVFAEYHFSGFGALAARDVPALLADPAWARRYARGDTQILERQAIALLGSLELSNEVVASLQWIQSPIDGSGVLSPGATITVSDALTLQASAYVPFGAPPSGLDLRSLYGALPLSAFLQFRYYD